MLIGTIMSVGDCNTGQERQMPLRKVMPVHESNADQVMMPIGTVLPVRGCNADRGWSRGRNGTIIIREQISSSLRTVGYLLAAIRQQDLWPTAG